MRLKMKKEPFEWNRKYELLDGREDISPAAVRYRITAVEGNLILEDQSGNELGRIAEKTAPLPVYRIYAGENDLGTVERRFSITNPRFAFQVQGWHSEGDFACWNYDLYDACSVGFRARAEGDWLLMETGEKPVEGILIAMAIYAGS